MNVTLRLTDHALPFSTSLPFLCELQKEKNGDQDFQYFGYFSCSGFKQRRT